MHLNKLGHFAAKFALALVLMGAFGAASRLSAQNQQNQTASPADKTPQSWEATAPGRITPKGGEVRLSVLSPGTVAEVLVGVSDHVKAGDLLVSLADDELFLKLGVAKTQVSLRRTERDQEEVKGATLDRRKAEDAVFDLSEAMFQSRLNLDREISKARGAKGNGAAIEAARKALSSATETLKTQEAALKANGANSAAEAALQAARADVALLEKQIEKGRLRAGMDGTILENKAKPGEAVFPSAETPLIVLGNTETLEVRAEVDERDAAKIKLGQPALIKLQGVPDHTFKAHVAFIAPRLAPPQIGRPEMRRVGDVDVLEVTLDLEGSQGAGLLPGMRSDVYFAPLAAANGSAPAPKTN